MKPTSLFLNGSSQAIRIPKEMRYEGDKVLIEKVNGVTIVVEATDPWAALDLAQALAAVGKFMAEGRDVNPIESRQEIKAPLKSARRKKS